MSRVCRSSGFVLSDPTVSLLSVALPTDALDNSNSYSRKLIHTGVSSITSVVFIRNSIRYFHI